MGEYLLHTTRTGDRWDALAYRYYGKAEAFGILCQANPDVPFTPLLPGGLKLRIPLVDEVDVAAAAPADDVRLPWL